MKIKIITFFDKLEDRIRNKLSRYPIIYAFLGGTGVVFFWRGVWHSADYMMFRFGPNFDPELLKGLAWWDGPLSVVIGSVILLLTGVFVANFVGSEIILSGLKGQKKIAEKTVQEVESEAKEIDKMEDEISEITDRIIEIENKITKDKKS